MSQKRVKKIYRAQHYIKKLWKVMNDIMGRNTNASASFIETDNGLFISKPKDMPSDLNNYFV